MDYDLVIAGGGLAGSALAIALAETGARMLILERERAARMKPAGGRLRKKAAI
jgi:menaquinone-9 beta-reductase